MQREKEKTDQLDFTKINKILCTKRQYQQTKKATQRMGEMFANHVSDKGLISGIYRGLKLNKKRNKRPDFKMGKGPE